MGRDEVNVIDRDPERQGFVQQGATTRVFGLTRSEYLLIQMGATLLTGVVGSSPTCRTMNP